ncbi:MAG TPA: ABC transporter permease [Candidatus Lustribacter sp.]|nr:ABC transporter permease [Candidatus Lustribacter sp.]
MRNLAPGIGFIIVVLAAIEAAARGGLVNAAVVPPPSAVAVQLAQILASGVFVMPLLQTLATLFAGYAAGCAAGIVLGILMGSFRAVYGLFEPLTELLRPIPKPALLPALILFLGLGSTMKITLVALAAFFPVLVSTVQGTRGVEGAMIDMARTFGYRPAQILWKIVLPAAAPYIAVGMRVSLGIALVVLVVAEMLAETGGLGGSLIAMQHQFMVRQTYGWLVIIAVIGFTLNALFVRVERRLTFWSVPS